MKKGELRHIRIEPADDGTVVTHVHKKETSTKAQKGPWLSDQSEEVHTHPTAEAAGKHVTELLRQHFDKASPKATDRAANAKNLRNPRGTGKSERFPSDDGPTADLG